MLEAYGFGLPAIVLIRSATASFLARGDTRTPMLVTLLAFSFNIALKLVFYRSFGAVGLAGATAAGSWLNLGLLVFLAVRRDEMRPDMLLGRIAAAVAIASFALAVVVLIGPGLIWLFAGHLPRFRIETTFGLVAMFGAIVYALVLTGVLKAFGIALPWPRRPAWRAGLV